MKRSFGGALLVVGTTVGAGMLSLPLITAACGLITTLILLVLSWSVMYVTSLKLLNLCAQHQEGANFTTLIEKRMPRPLQVGLTFIYLLLLYSLMSAYTTQGASMIATLSRGHMTPVPIDALVFLIIFGFIIANYRLSDYINRSFLTLKLIFFTLAIVTMVAYIHGGRFFTLPLSLSALVFAWPTLLPSFGFQNIVPVLYDYQNGNLANIKRSILLGSLIILAIYFIWMMTCLTMMPQTGPGSYQTLFQKGNTLHVFINMIQNKTHNEATHTFLSIFINVSVVTTFICSGLSLFHYIKDCFQRFDITLPTIWALLLTFIPPYLFTTLYPQGFVLALQFASIFAVLIFVYTPVMLQQNWHRHKANIYPLLMGSIVIIAQILNLLDITQPFG